MDVTNALKDDYLEGSPLVIRTLINLKTMTSEQLVSLHGDGAFLIPVHKPNKWEHEGLRSFSYCINFSHFPLLFQVNGRTIDKIIRSIL